MTAVMSQSAVMVEIYDNNSNINTDDHSSMLGGHEAEIIIPGSFVVLQGMAGDGVANTMDSLPDLPYDTELERLLWNNDPPGVQQPQQQESHQPVVNDSLPHATVAAAPMSSSSTVVEEADDFMDAEESSAAGDAGSCDSSVVAMMDTTTTMAAAATTTTTTTTTTLRNNKNSRCRRTLPTTTPPASSSSSLTVGQLAAQNTTLGGLTGLMQQPPPPPPRSATATTSSLAPAPTAMVVSEEDAEVSSFVVVTDHEGDDEEEEDRPPVSAAAARAAALTTTTTPTISSIARNRNNRHQVQQQQQLPLYAQELLEDWNRNCRQSEQFKQQEWQDNVTQMGATYSAGSNTTTTTNIQDHVFLRRRATTNVGNGIARIPNTANDFWWLTNTGKIAILRDIPTQLSNGTVLKSVIGSLAPGSTVVATDIVYLDSQTLQRIQMPPVSSSGGSTMAHCIYPRGQLGWICLVKIDESSTTSSSSGNSARRSGYVALSLDGYPLLGPGVPSMYTDPNCWIWRVTCPAGAFVREGLDLNTHHIDTLPYGSLVRVMQRTVNSQGLCRLRVSAVVENYGKYPPRNGAAAAAAGTTAGGDSVISNTATQSPTSRRRPSSTATSYLQQQLPAYTTSRVVIDGWCSEFLNPLSGNRGSVLEPLPFPVPALYKITLPMGAVIRSHVELSTPEVGNLPQGATVKVTGRAYSEHPVETCLERLHLAGDGGWMSVRLNRPPPHDEAIVEMLGTDSTFDPDQPGLYHWKQMAEARRLEQREGNQHHNDLQELSSVDSDAVSSNGGGDGDMMTLSSESATGSRRTTSGVGAAVAASTTNTNRPPTTSPHQNHHRQSSTSRMDTDQCLICLTEARTATIVHGETGHVACCLLCARILRARGDRCPVCRLPIDLVIQHFWA